MLLVAKININDYDQLRESFVDNYGTQTSKKVVITDFNNLNQKKDKPVQVFFSRVGDIAYNYNVKKPIAKIMRPVPEVPEDEEEENAVWLAIPAAQEEWPMRGHTNNSQPMILLIFVCNSLWPDYTKIFKSKTADLYEAFKIAH